MKRFLKPYYRRLQTVLPLPLFVLEYKRAIAQVKASYSGDARECSREVLFERFLTLCSDKRCLQIGVKDHIGQKFGRNWLSVDKYDQRDFIDYHHDLQALEFESGSFDGAVCWSILEHIPHPEKAIAELLRVLRPGGHIWVQLPMLFPYHEAPKDYWRVTPDGLRVWMSEFDEVSCGCDFWAGTSLVAATFFHGTKKSKEQSVD